MKKRIFALALALCMMLSVMPTSFAGNGFLTLDNGEREPSQPSGILTPGDPVLPEEDLSGEPHLTLDDPAEGSQPAPDDPIDEPHLTLDDPVDEPEDRPARQWRPAPFEEETFTQCDICGYLDGSHAVDCPVVNPPEEQAPAQSTIAEYKPAPMSAATYQDIYDSMMSAETLAEYKAELSALSADLQEAFFSLLTVEEREALSEREDSLAHDALTVTGAENATRAVTVEARASAFSFALHEALRQLGQDLIVSIYGRILESIDLPQNDYTMLETITPTDGARYQWQIQADDDLWVDIYNETGSIIRVSYAMVASLLDRYDTVQVRCEITGEDGVSFTDPVEVCVDYTSEDVYIDAEEEPAEGDPIEDETVEDTVAEDGNEGEETAVAGTTPEDGETAEQPMAMTYAVRFLSVSANGEDTLMNDDDGIAPVSNEDAYTNYSIVIHYVFQNGTTAAPDWTATVATGSTYGANIDSPAVLGYKPDSETVHVSAPEKTTYTVTYSPAEVEYTVKHYQQNVSNDEYTLTDTETKKGFTESAVGAGLAKTDYTGFYSLLYDTTTTIAADGSTVVEVYYDRYYYLMNFDLDGGYGVEPIYARYGTPISVDTPTKPGYTFESWTPSIPTVMPDHNTSYKASWKIGESGFTVVFWYENANDNGYSVAGTYKPADVAPGTEQKSGDYQNTDFEGKDADEHKHFTYNADKAETVTVKGDGSTVLNVYFTRNTYTLTFVGAGTERVLVCGYNYEHEHNDACCKYGGTGIDHWYHRDSCCKLGLSEHTHRNRCYKDNCLTITAKYQADIHGNFPIKDGNDTIWWKVPEDCESFKPGTSLGSIDTMPGEDITFKSSETQSGASIHYYIETLNGEAGAYTHDGKNFKLYKSITSSKYVSLTYSEEFHDIIGFTQWWSDPKFDKMEQGGVAYEGKTLLGYYYIKDNNYLCYTRNSYNLKFYNYNAYVDGKGGSVQYEAPLGSYNFTPDYPEKLEKNAYVFAGWYTTAGCYEGSEADLNTMTMPASDVILYAKWTPKNHTVKTYHTKEAMDSGAAALGTWDAVPHGTVVEKPEDPTNDPYIFVGWFYISDAGEEKAFDFSMPVNRDLNLYAKWSSNTLMEYTIRYELEDGTEIAPPTTGSALAGSTKTFDAKTGMQLKEGYQSGYFPKVSSHSMTVDIEGTAENKKNEFTFVYVAKPEVEYTVKYLEKGTDNQLAPPKTVETTTDVVTETFVPVTGYMPDAYQKRLVLAADDNEIIFWYTKDDVHAPVQIIHWIQNIVGDGYTEYQSSTNLNGVIGNQYPEYPESPLTIAGFQYNEETSNPSGTLTEAGLVLNLYYDRIEYPYAFRFLEQGTEKQLADPVTGNARYQAQVTQGAKTIPGYKLVSAESQAINIQIEDPADTANKNVKVFYYIENAVTINYQVEGPAGCGTLDNYSESVKAVNGQPNGSTPTTNEGFKFVGWFTDKDCTKKVAAEWVSDNKLTPRKTKNYGTEQNLVMGYEAATYYAKFEYDLTDLTITKVWEGNPCYYQDAIFTVRGNGLNLKVVITVPDDGNTNSVTITGLTVSQTYTVTEDSGWSWRYTAGNPQSKKLEPIRNEISYTNSLNADKIYWLDDSDHKKNTFGVKNGN